MLESSILLNSDSTPKPQHDVYSPTANPASRSKAFSQPIDTGDILETPLDVADAIPCFAVVALSPVVVAEQICPHAYPLGQHPPPALAAHEVQPWAQLPEEDFASVPVWATITTPFVFTKVVEADGGQDVTLQSRPTRQHPP
ncbi:hypothetical protein MMC31_008095 [Peltigera leucophlebia]|nr:hypothetical protein [Peltigera leucophlebia]